MYRKNHFSPKGYLKGFTPDETFINKLTKYIYIKEKYIDRRKAISSVGREEDLYIILDDKLYQEFKIPNEPTWIEENCFKKIENNIRDIIQRIISQSGTNEDWELMRDFVFTCIIRNPHYIQRFQELCNEKEEVKKAKKDFKKIIKKIWPNYTEKEFQAHLNLLIAKLKNSEKFDPKYRAKRKMQENILKYFFDIESKASKTFKNLLEKGITIYKINDDSEFITGDNPAYSHLSEVGFNIAYDIRATIIIPLDRKHMLSFEGPPLNVGVRQIKYIEISEKVVNIFNYLTFKYTV